jgi:hypothetical protein
VRPRRFVVSLLALLSACGLVVEPASGTSCAFVIEWNGVVYGAADLDRSVAFGASLGEATVPACEDTAEAGCEREGGEKIDIFRLRGIDPHVAFGAPSPFGRDAFLAPGFFPELPDHPLHDAVYGSPRRPDERAGWRCGEPILNLRGSVMHTPGSGLVFGVRFEGEVVRTEAGRTVVFVDARTSITGFDEYGLPRITEGDRVRATVRECTASGGRYKVVADAITNASR